ncbi:hypothetical protein ACFYQA_29825 [Streptomyces sp. NPDC005774]|uniref:hypothetical protein n=1 Tax=Streptomyces sp. NPDC005774 TaxID=3364728 RepID=UPI0036AA8AB4
MPLLVVSVITASVAYLYGPGRPACAVRTTAQRGTTAAGRAPRRAGMRTGSTGRLLADHRAWTTGCAFAAGAPALWNHPTVGAVVLVVGVLLAVLAVLAVLALFSATAPRGHGESAP